MTAETTHRDPIDILISDEPDSIFWELGPSLSGEPHQKHRHFGPALTFDPSGTTVAPQDLTVSGRCSSGLARGIRVWTVSRL